MRNKKLIQANEQMLQRQLQKGFKPQWYVVYHLNDGFNWGYPGFVDRSIGVTP